VKQQQLLCQLDYLEKKQQTIINNKLKNLEKIVLLSFFANSSLLSSLIDIALKQIVFSNIIRE